MANGADIIIKGSSVDIDYDDAKYPKEPGKPRNHKAGDNTITRVTVEDENNAMQYDSNDEAADHRAGPSMSTALNPSKPASQS